MGDNTYTYGLNYDLIKRAVHGEKDALEKILRIYDAVYNALVTREILGFDGKFHREIDKEKKIQVQMPFESDSDKMEKTDINRMLDIFSFFYVPGCYTQLDKFLAIVCFCSFLPTVALRLKQVAWTHQARLKHTLHEEELRHRLFWL